jgi:hypothetical protein
MFGSQRSHFSAISHLVVDVQERLQEGAREVELRYLALREERARNPLDHVNRVTFVRQV